MDDGGLIEKTLYILFYFTGEKEQPNGCGFIVLYAADPQEARRIADERIRSWPLSIHETGLWAYPDGFILYPQWAGKLRLPLEQEE